jgi:putative redox protein
MLILKRGREAVTDCVVDIEAERATTDPKVFTKIQMNYTVTGLALDRKKVERAVALSAEKYCSASAILAKTAELSHTITLVDSQPTSTGASA